MKKLVIIPTYNERENVSRMISKVMSLFGGYDLLIVDDGSPDGTAAIVRGRQEEFPGRVHLIERSGKLGLGTAYIAGFRWALAHGYDLVYEMDCDFSHNPDDLERLTAAVTGGADVAVGSRYSRGVNVVNWPMSRRVLETIDLDAVRMVGYGFQVEMKYTAWKLGFRIDEVSIVFVDRTEGTSKMSGGIFGEAFWGVLRLPWRRIRPKRSAARE